MKIVTFRVKKVLLLFGQLMRKLGQIFMPTSSHTVQNNRSEGRMVIQLGKMCFCKAINSTRVTTIGEDR